MFYWLEVLGKPLETFKKIEQANKAFINILFILITISILQYFSILNLIDTLFVEELVELSVDIPETLLVVIMSGFQLFITFVNIIFLGIIFKLISLFFFKTMNFKTIMFVIILAQLPNSLSLFINSFFIQGFMEGNVLSIFSLAYLVAGFVDLPIVLHILNTVELFQVWSAVIVAAGFYVYNGKYSFGKTFTIVFVTYLLIKTVSSFFI
ncbi:hypothetical protein [Halalkalibacter krulwichiae]|uniref:Yip1 domain protein n=1 Tax=Halalkalibacter krulwichiae TaxID=199441 RepID=A0A1X9MKX6_9BACI|nr:hypothetical protein [Halalkalibacter krulwichiae]ARK32391.1 Yip1 domain protein [Halalkalibacter krulwichiae]